MNAIQPFIFEQPIETPVSTYDIIKTNRINNHYPSYSYVSAGHIIEDHKVNINYNNQNITSKSIGKDNSNININIDTENKDKPIGFKLDLLFVDIEIYPKVPKILKCIGNLF